MQLGGAVLFTFRNAKGYGHSTAKERKHPNSGSGHKAMHKHSQKVRSHWQYLQGFRFKIQIFQELPIFFLLTSHFFRDFQEKSVTCLRQCTVSCVSEAAWGQCPLALRFTLPVSLGTRNSSGWELLSAPQQEGPECLSHSHPFHNLLL